MESMAGAEPTASPSQPQDHAAPASTTSATIRLMEEATKQRIVAGQAVFDLASAVKELVDNALDAHSKSINIRLFNQGLDFIEVSDDGCGVPMESRPFLATPHATSKIRNFSDIYNGCSGGTLGFRGEALFCLANLSQNLVVATRTAEEENAQRMEFQRDGCLRPGSVQIMPKKVGTTVAVVRLLEAVPVRRMDFRRRIGEQKRKLVRLVSGYCVFCVGVAIQLFDIQSQTNEKLSLLSTPHHTHTLAETITSVFGSKFYSSLKEISVDLKEWISTTASSQDGQLQAETQEAGQTWQVYGYISKAPTVERVAGVGDQQLYAINGRPVDMPRFSRMMNEVWRSLCGPGRAGSSHPSCILQFILPRWAYDVNVSPDKREVILPHETELLQLLQQQVTQLWTEQTEGQFMPAPSLELLGRKRGRFDEDENIVGHTYDGGGGGNLNDEASPNKFNRRYAFSHDLACIRLQHEFDDGRRPRSEDDERQDAEARAALQESQQQEAEGISENESDTGNEMDDDIPLLGAQQRKEDAKDDIKEPNRSEQSRAVVARNPFESSRATSSVVEGRLWRVAKRRFQETSVADIYRDELQQQEQQNSLDQCRASAPVADRYQRHRRGASAAQTQTTTVSLYNLEQFGFNAHKIVATRAVSGGGSALGGRLPEHPPPPPRLKDNPEGQLKRVSFDSAVTLDGDNRAMSSESSSNHSPLAAALAAHAEPMQVSPVVLKVAVIAESSESYNKGSWTGEVCAKDDKPKEEENKISLTSGSQGSQETPTVWFSFSGTKDVIMAAQQERIAMRERRIRFQSRETGPSENDDKKSAKISLQKQDFKKMQVIGQFNMGFILAKSPDNHLWVMDQHACDEKYNFEKLVKETEIGQQPLIAPMELELSPSEENCIIDNMEIFETNGFRFIYDKDKPARRRLSLTAIPHSGAENGRKAVQFGKEDVAALCAILSGDDGDDRYDVAESSGTGVDGTGMFGNNAVRRYAGRSWDDTGNADRVIARLPKAIAMFASRACRNSIMIGKSLSVKEMDRVVSRLADLDQPWNCPHGRPTMTHVADLRALIVEDELSESKHLAGPTVSVMTQDVGAQEETLGDDEAQAESTG